MNLYFILYNSCEMWTYLLPSSSACGDFISFPFLAKAQAGGLLPFPWTSLMVIATQSLAFSVLINRVGGINSLCKMELIEGRNYKWSLTLEISMTNQLNLDRVGKLNAHVPFKSEGKICKIMLNTQQQFKCAYLDRN